MIRVNLLTLPAFDAINESLINRLAPAQQAKARRLGPQRKHTFIWSRLFLTQLVCELTRTTEATWAIIEQESLPPLLCDRRSATGDEQHPVFSISHSGDLIAITLGFAEHTAEPILGIDVERINQRRRLATAEYFCSLAQLQALSDTPGELRQQHYLTKLWTQKEAWFKARHTPILNAQLKALHFTPDTVNADIFTADLGSDYVLSVCCNTASPTVTAKRYGCHELTTDKQLIEPLDDLQLKWQSYRSHL